MSSNRQRRAHPSTLERAVIGSVKTAEWLTPSDNGAVWLLRDVMAALDVIRRQGTLDGIAATPARDLAELAGRALQLLTQLGLTPTSRFRLGLWEVEIDDAFAEVVRLARSSSGDLEE